MDTAPSGSAPTVHGGSVVRQMNEWAVLERLDHRQGRAVSDLAVDTGLSRPTVNAALGRLGQQNLVVRRPKRHGSAGRSPHLWVRNARVGVVVALDVGRSRVRAAVGDLGDGVLAVHRSPRSQDADLVMQLADVLDAVLCSADVERRHVLATVVSAPGVFDARTRGLGLAYNQRIWSDPAFVDRLSVALGLALDVDNDANLAAVGEQSLGHGHDVADFVYLSLGTGVGAGVVLDGKLRQGRRGIVGEVAYLPIGRGEGDVWPLEGALEAQLSAASLICQARELGGASITTADQMAEWLLSPEGGVLRRRIIDNLAQTVMSFQVMVDPQLVVVGGGIGAHLGDLLPLVEQRLAVMSPLAVPQLVITRVGEDGPLLGAIQQGRRLAWRRAFEQTR